MLDEFEKSQKIVYKILKNSIDHNKCSHAYLFETNGYQDKDKLILSFAKALLCSFNYTNNKKCQNCHQCENIDKNLYSEIKIINPDGMWIKKEQLLNLQEEFKTKSLQSKRKVYIINHAECLNTASANSILKFLEEPEEGIVAILVTDNIHQLLDTIISRCQIITLAPNLDLQNQTIEEKISNLIENKYDLETLKELITNTIDFINYYEKKKVDTIIYTKQIFLNKFIEKDHIVTFFEIMILFYKDIVNVKLGRNPEVFTSNDLNSIAETYELEDLNNNIQIILENKNNLKINANINLLIDKLIMDLGGVQ